jgi:osmoprotectant transport system substrate-binding protein
MDLGLMYRALETQQVDLIAAANTDGLIAARDLVVLEDDAHYFPPYDAVPIVRREIEQQSPEVFAALQRLAGRISAEDMRRLNYAIDGAKKDVVELVREFLAEKNFFAFQSPETK